MSDIVGNHNKTPSHEYGTGRCDKCGVRQLEQFKICMHCLKGKRPSLDKTGHRVRHLTNNAPGLNIKGNK